MLQLLCPHCKRVIDALVDVHILGPSHAGSHGDSSNAGEGAQEPSGGGHGHDGAVAFPKSEMEAVALNEARPKWLPCLAPVEAIDGSASERLDKATEAGRDEIPTEAMEVGHDEIPPPARKVGRLDMAMEAGNTIALKAIRDGVSIGVARDEFPMAAMVEAAAGNRDDDESSTPSQDPYPPVGPHSLPVPPLAPMAVAISKSQLARRHNEVATVAASTAKWPRHLPPPPPPPPPPLSS